MTAKEQSGDTWLPPEPRIYRYPRDIVECVAQKLQRWPVPYICDDEGDGYPLLDFLSNDPNDETIASGREACGELAAEAVEVVVIWLRNDMTKRGSIAPEHRASVAEYFRQHFDYREPPLPINQQR